MIEAINTMDNLFSYLEKNPRQTKNIFYDIETLTVNQQTKNPSKLISKEYIASFSFIYQNKINYFFLPSLDKFLKLLHQCPSTTNIALTGHNIFGYDNHFLLRSLIDIGYTPVNMERDNINVKYWKHDESIRNPVECLRVKRKSSVELKFTINNLKISTVDTYLKSNGKLETMGKKLLNIGAITDEYLKLDNYDYELYNKDETYEIPQLRQYCTEIYKTLSPTQLQYCRNDVVILALYYLHYHELYPGYDYKKLTLSQNIMNDYNINALASLQLKNTFFTKDFENLTYREKKRHESHIKYSDFVFNGKNVYNYIKHNYSGGLVIYNDRYIGKIIQSPLLYIDRNSSYPYEMYKQKYPTYLTDHGKNKNLSTFHQQEFSIFRLDIETFNDMTLQLKSHFIRCAVTKYLYKGHNDITLNTNHLKLFKIFGCNLPEFTCIDYLTFETKRFASHDKLEEFYKLKQQAKSQYLLNMEDITNIKPTTQKLEKLESTEEEIYLAKVSMNGLSGLPALRATYPIYLLEENGEITGHPKGYSNLERNCVFSVFTTSSAFYHLLKPLHTLTGEEIDDNVYYTDTDSLILSEQIKEKLDIELDENNLGAWDIEHHIKKLYIANNKFYCLETDKEKIVVKSCGVRKDIFDKHTNPKHKDYQKIPFEQFVETYMSPGCKLPNLKNVINTYGTISLYQSETEIKKAPLVLPEQINHETKKTIDKIKGEVFTEMRRNDFLDGTLYIDSPLVILSLTECMPEENDTYQKRDIKDLINIYKISKYYT